VQARASRRTTSTFYVSFGSLKRHADTLGRFVPLDVRENQFEWPEVGPLTLRVIDRTVTTWKRKLVRKLSKLARVLRRDDTRLRHVTDLMPSRNFTHPMSCYDTHPNRAMAKDSDSPERFHLAINTTTIRSGREWSPRFSGWCVARVNSGSGYWVQPRSNRELPTGSVLVASRATHGSVRASQLGEMSLAFYHVRPDRLAGLVTVGEGKSLETAALRPESNVRIFPPEAAISLNLGNLGEDAGCTVASRLKLLGLFIDSFGDELKQSAAGESIKAETRLKQFLEQASPLELLDMSLADLARATGCTPRHVSRIFCQVVGRSFRAQQAEIRLRRAVELLNTTSLKVVDVSLESGYSSLSLFNLMFKSRYGLSPGKWRQKRSEKRQPAQNAGSKVTVCA
jgi:AraC-like DNA-binding protein